MSLLELLLALALGAMATLSLIALLLGGLRSMRKAGDVSEASSVARELLERISSAQFAHTLANETFDGKAGNPAVGGFPPAPYPFRENNQRYYCRVQSQLLDSSRALIRVEVSGVNGVSVRLEKIVVR
jgi:hypothetical protein